MNSRIFDVVRYKNRARQEKYGIILWYTNNPRGVEVLSQNMRIEEIALDMVVEKVLSRDLPDKKGRPFKDFRKIADYFEDRSLARG